MTSKFSTTQLALVATVLGIPELDASLPDTWGYWNDYDQIFKQECFSPLWSEIDLKIMNIHITELSVTNEITKRGIKHA